MSVKYTPYENTKVVIDHITYQNEKDKIAFLPVEKLSEGELQRLIDAKFIKKLEVDESGKPRKPAKSGKKSNDKTDEKKPEGDKTEGDKTEGNTTQA